MPSTQLNSSQQAPILAHQWGLLAKQRFLSLCRCRRILIFKGPSVPIFSLSVFPSSSSSHPQTPSTAITAALPQLHSYFVFFLSFLAFQVHIVHSFSPHHFQYTHSLSPTSTANHSLSRCLPSRLPYPPSPRLPCCSQVFPKHMFPKHMFPKQMLPRHLLPTPTISPWSQSCLAVTLCILVSTSRRPARTAAFPLTISAT